MKLISKHIKQHQFLKTLLIIGGVLPALLLGVSNTSIAQEKSHFLETMEVTAQKKKENVQDVPMSMSVFSDTLIEDAEIKDIKDLTFHTPNLYPKQSTNQNMLIMRGLYSHSVALNTSVGLFVDNISYPLTFMQNPNLVDIERVEILRGPQGTLYGRNTESGAINIITKQPGNEPKGKVFIEPSFYDAQDKFIPHLRTGASVSGPVVKDKLFFGGAIQYEYSKGYMENIYNDDDRSAKTDHKNMQAKLRYTPSTPWDINFTANASRLNDGYAYARYMDGNSKTEQYKTNWDGGNEWEDKNDGQALKVSYSGKKYTMESITTRNSFNTDFINDGEFGNLPFPDQVWEFDDTIYSQEFRISTPSDSGDFTWIAGIYGFSEEVDAHAEYFGKTVLTDYDTEGYAAFGQATYTLFDKLHLTAGLRYDHQDSEGKQKLSTLTESYSADVDHDEWLPKVSVAYDIDESVMVYSTVSKGILAGGYDYAFASSSDTLTFKPEFSWNYEIGTKTSWFNNRLILNASVFYIEIEDKQVEDFVNGSPIRKISNAAEASSKGFEVELTARPTGGWQFFAGLGYTKAEFDKWVSNQSDGSTFDFESKKLPYSPDYTYNAGAQYNHSSGLFGRADITGVSSFYTQAKNTKSSEVDGYKTVNVKLGYDMEDFQISIWSKNIFAEDYIVTKSYYVGGHSVQDGEPRTIGTTIAYRF